jgi:hypothetical protein
MRHILAVNSAMAVVRVRRLFASFIAGSIVPVLLIFVAHAQVLRDPRLPRTPAGKPILTAPAPKAPDGKPDLSGIWRAVSGKYLRNLAADNVRVPFTPAAAALYNEHRNNTGKSLPFDRCLPRGVPAALLVREHPFKIVQTSGVILILYDESLHHRQIFLDGRGFPEDPTPAWFGYSIAKWEGDSLVAETMGFNEETWIDDGGHPHSDAMHVIERFRRRTVGKLEVEITIDDPKSYTKPWTAAVLFELLPDTDLGEHLCAVN